MLELDVANETDGSYHTDRCDLARYLKFNPNRGRALTVPEALVGNSLPIKIKVIFVVVEQETLRVYTECIPVQRRSFARNHGLTTSKVNIGDELLGNERGFYAHAILGTDAASTEIEQAGGTAVVLIFAQEIAHLVDEECLVLDHFA